MSILASFGMDDLWVLSQVSIVLCLGAIIKT